MWEIELPINTLFFIISKKVDRLNSAMRPRSFKWPFNYYIPPVPERIKSLIALSVPFPFLQFSIVILIDKQTNILIKSLNKQAEKREREREK